MNKEANKDFIERTEGLAKPVDITAISFLGEFNKYLPLNLQRTIMKKGSDKVPYMGFIVDPYCFFLAYEIKDRAGAQALLSEDYELAETSLFAGDVKRPLAIISSFSVRTSVFTGMRVECYVIARNRKSGLLSWIIVDYETNTFSHDPKNGFCGYTCDPGLFTTTPYGEVIVEARNIRSLSDFSVRADIRGAPMRDLDWDLWVEGNMSVDYGGKLKDPTSEPFSLIFDPVLMKEAQEISLDKVTVGANGFLPDLIDGKKPLCAALFPYTQHFIIKQDLSPGAIAQESDILSQLDAFMTGRGFKTMSGSDIKIPLLRSMLASAFINLCIIAFLAWKAFG